VIAGRRAPYFARGPDAHADARAARDRAHLAHQHHRAEEPAELLEPRSEIGDFDAAAVPVEKPGLEDRRVRDVGLLGAGEIGELDLEKPVVVRPAPIAQQGENTASLSKRGRQDQTMGPVRVDQRPRRSNWPIRARSRLVTDSRGLRSRSA